MNFQPILDYFIAKFKLKYDGLENIKTDRVNTVVFNLLQIKQSKFFLGHPVLNVDTLDIPETTLRPLEQAFSHTNRSNIFEYLKYFFLYLFSGFNNPSPLVWITFKW